MCIRFFKLWPIIRHICCLETWKFWARIGNFLRKSRGFGISRYFYGVLYNICIYIAVLSLWTGWHLKSPALWLLAQRLLRRRTKKTSKLGVTGLYEGQYYEICFRSMTSSCTTDLQQKVSKCTQVVKLLIKDSIIGQRNPWQFRMPLYIAAFVLNILRIRNGHKLLMMCVSVPLSVYVMKIGIHPLYLEGYIRTTVSDHQYLYQPK